MMNINMEALENLLALADIEYKVVPVELDGELALYTDPPADWVELARGVTEEGDNVVVFAQSHS